MQPTDQRGSRSRNEETALYPDGTTTATGPDGTRILHSHRPQPVPPDRD